MQPFVFLEMPFACYIVLQISAARGMFQDEAMQRPF